ncbi:MAG: HAD family hydrolase [Oligoflexia bacterium]|nr:HAD family hydrolase [Oligoflexia bacterium]
MTTLADTITKKMGFLLDMDGVIYIGKESIPGGQEFVDYLVENAIPFLFLTNNSRPTTQDIAHRLKKIGYNVTKNHIYTSAMATAQFLASQRPGGSAFVIGEGGLCQALYDHGHAIDDTSPENVVVGEGRTLTLEIVEKAIDMIIGGSKLIATNLDPAPRIPGWTKPGTGAVIAMLEAATGVKAFSVGKPSPIMMRFARKELGLQTSETIMIGDTMETDILGGVSMGYKTILTLTGSTKAEELSHYPYRPYLVINSIADMIDILKAQ